MNRLPYIPNRLFISDVNLKNKSPVFETTSANGKSRVLSRNFSYFEGSITIAAIDQEGCKLADAFFLQNNKAVPFLVSIPEYDAPLKPIQGTPTVQGNYPASTDTIRVEGFTGQISAGDCFTIQGDMKVYTALTSLSDAGLLTLYPSLRKPVTTATPLNFNPVFKVRMVEDKLDYKPKARYARLYDITIKEDLE